MQNNNGGAKPLRLGMVGGGKDAFIGAVHRMAARLDNRFSLVAGALSSTPEKAIASGQELGLERERCYESYEDMAQKEAAREDGIDAVAIVTPNFLHFPVAKFFIEKGIHVICDKPVTSSLDEALELKKITENSKALFILTYNYTGYPLVRQARQMIQQGKLGRLRLVQVEYAQDWMAEAIEKQGVKQAEWRTDPKRSGIGGAIGDIGTHAYNLCRFVTELEVESLSADVHSLVDGRQLDDNAHIMLRFKNNEQMAQARGILWCSQVAIGNENNLKIRVYGDLGGLEWEQDEANVLYFSQLNATKQIITRAGLGGDNQSQRVTRLPAGHPEGYIEAFATIYSEAAAAIQAFKNGTPLDKNVVYPTINDGVDGLRFVEACVHSSCEDSKWVPISAN